MLYHGMSADDEKKTKGDWLRGHSDASSLTFITPQPMASLQFRDYHDGQWKFVGYRPNALVVNLGDRFEVRPAFFDSSTQSSLRALMRCRSCPQFLTGSFAKSTIHRVVAPPADQRGHRRLGLSASLSHTFSIFRALAALRRLSAARASSPSSCAKRNHSSSPRSSER